MEISKSVSIEDLENVFGGAIPDHHPQEYINSRLHDKLAFVAKKNKKAIGFLIYTTWWGNCPFIELIKVKEENQREGIGTELLNSAIQEIISKNYKTLISSSEVINDMGKNFHQRFGFETLSTLQLPHGEELFFSISLENIK